MLAQIISIQWLKRETTSTNRQRDTYFCIYNVIAMQTPQ
jgi:hypothetical protein